MHPVLQPARARPCLGISIQNQGSLALVPALTPDHPHHPPRQNRDHPPCLLLHADKVRSEDAPKPLSQTQLQTPHLAMEMNRKGMGVLVRVFTNHAMRSFLTLFALCLAPRHSPNATATTMWPSITTVLTLELTIQAGESVSFINYGGWHSINGETSYTGDSFDNPVSFSLPANYGFFIFPNCMGTVTFDVPGSITTGWGRRQCRGRRHVRYHHCRRRRADHHYVIVNSDVHTLLEAGRRCRAGRRPLR